VVSKTSKQPKSGAPKGRLIGHVYLMPDGTIRQEIMAYTQTTEGTREPSKADRSAAECAEAPQGGASGGWRSQLWGPASGRSPLSGGRA
jgi:hypothetical protein